MTTFSKILDIEEAPVDKRLSCPFGRTGDASWNLAWGFLKLNNGGVAEWFKAAVLKTVGDSTPAGSNPVASAIFKAPTFNSGSKELS